MWGSLGADELHLDFSLFLCPEKETWGLFYRTENTRHFYKNTDCCLLVLSHSDLKDKYYYLLKAYEALWGKRSSSLKLCSIWRNQLQQIPLTADTSVTELQTSHTSAAFPPCLFSDVKLKSPPIRSVLNIWNLKHQIFDALTSYIAITSSRTGKKTLTFQVWVI